MKAVHTNTQNVDNFLYGIQGYLINSSWQYSATNSNINRPNNNNDMEKKTTIILINDTYNSIWASVLHIYTP